MTDISHLLSSHSLKQVVQVSTRSSATLDLTITNLSNLYGIPQTLAPLGSSDNNIVAWTPCSENANHRSYAKPVKRFIRRYPRSGAFGRWVTAHDWFGELGPNPKVNDLTVSFTSHLLEAIDRIFPLKTVKCHPSDKPWITPAIKKLMKDRQKAFHNHNIPMWRSLRHKVQHKITERKKSFYKNRAQHLRKNDCRKWWKIINKMSGKSEKTKPFSLERDGEILNDLQLAKQRP